jgi:hypothetical protein
MRKMLLIWVSVLSLILPFTILPEQGKAGSDYRFEVTYEYLNVTMKSDGSAHYYYEIEFHSLSSGDPIDIVDIYMPVHYGCACK